MTRKIRPIVLAALLTAFLTSGSFAEFAAPVSPGGGIYDQPSSVVNGTTVHVAFIGAPTVSGPFSVYYAAIYGYTDFTLPALSGLTVTSSVLIDNASVTGDPFYDARHPKIAVQAPGTIVIFFQARATAADSLYSLYRAQLSIDNNAVAGMSIKAVSGIPAGDVGDISYAVATPDNTARLACSIRTGASGPFDTWFARIGLDNAQVVRSPIRLSAPAGTTGSRPIPSLRLDSINRSHIAWTADNGTPGTFSAVYYAMVKEFNDPLAGISDNAAIAATGVIGRDRRWGHPQVLVSPTSNSLVYLFATDEPTPGASGNLSYVSLNPDAALLDNNSVNLGTNNTFLLHPPGVAILPAAFDLYRAEAHIDLGGRIHLTGYGNDYSAPIYYAAKTVLTYPFLDFLVFPTPVALGNAPASFQLPGDYSKAAIAFLSNRGIVFWSGTDNTNPSNRALMVTGLPTINEYVNFNESGCSTAREKSSDKAGAWVDLLLLAIPLALLKFRFFPRRG